MQGSEPVRRPRYAPHVTIGNLRSLRQMVEIGCDSCLHVAHVNPRELPLHGLMLVKDAYNRLRCSMCGSKPSYSRPDGRGIDG